MYTEPPFKTKKALKEAVASGTRVTVYSPGPFNSPIVGGQVAVEGPSFKPHTWYAMVEVEGNRVIRVRN